MYVKSKVAQKSGGRRDSFLKAGKQAVREADSTEARWRLRKVGVGEVELAEAAEPSCGYTDQQLWPKTGRSKPKRDGSCR